MSHHLAATAQYELHFQSIAGSGRSYAFPCDPEGHVDLDTMSDRARNNYLYARAMMGRETTVPRVRRTPLH